MLEINFSKNAVKNLEALPKEVIALILEKIENYANGQKADIKKLKGRSDYRLRVGSYRVFFEKDADKLTILGVSHRQNAY